MQYSSMNALLSLALSEGREAAADQRGYWCLISVTELALKVCFQL